MYFIKSETSDSFVSHFDGHFTYLKTLDFYFKCNVANVSHSLGSVCVFKCKVASVTLWSLYVFLSTMWSVFCTVLGLSCHQFVHVITFYTVLVLSTTSNAVWLTSFKCSLVHGVTVWYGADVFKCDVVNFRTVWKFTI